MQVTRDRLAGELGKQTGVAVQLNPPQRWDGSAPSRPPAVRLTACPLACDPRPCARMHWIYTSGPPGVAANPQNYRATHTEHG